MNARGVSPVVGIALLIAITLLLAAMVSVAFVHLSDTSDDEERVDGLLESTADSEQALALTGEPGDEPRTSGGDVLEFRVENTLDRDVTVEGFEFDATGIDTGVTVDDGNAEEVELRRVSQTGRANRDGSPDSFAADGSRYAFVADSTTNGQNAEIDADADDAEIDVRRFSQNVGTLEIVGSRSEADLVVSLVLSDDSDQEFFFRQK